MNQPLIVSMTDPAAANLMFGGASVLVNGLSPLAAYQAQHPGDVAHQALIGGIVVPAGATYNEGDGVYGYANVYSTTTNGVAVGGGGLAYANGAKVWASNFTVNDQGFSAPTLDGSEYDFGASNMASHPFGIAMFSGMVGGTPASSGYLIFEALDEPVADAITLGDGAAQIALQIGAQAATANSDGQAIDLAAYDQTDTKRIVGIQAIHAINGANLNLDAPGLIVAAGVLRMQSGVQRGVRVISSGTTDTAALSDVVIAWNSSASAEKIETIPTCGPTTAGATLDVMDEEGNANSYQILVAPISGTINGAASVGMNFPYGEMTATCDGAGNWIAQSLP